LNIAPSLLLQAATAAAGHQHYPPGTLYVVATPIGNLADLTLRAVHVLGRVDAVACEDKRVTAQLLNHLGLHKPLLALHGHNEHVAAAAVLSRLAGGESVAYVSDAGTPAVSDPGAVLVAQAAAAGHKVVPLPGASSALAALSVAGDTAGAGFRFVGFLPAKGGERRAALAAALADAATQVLFEAPHRINALAAELAAAAPQRRVTLARELTKQFETVVTEAAAELPGWLAADGDRQRGEFVLVLHALPAAPAAAGALAPATVQTLRLLLRELPLKQAVALAADITGAPRKALYPFALAERDRPPPGGPPERHPGAGTSEANAAGTGDGEAAGPADPDAEAPA
jgi:16S rRNA (cytidine1402-2'-O)-methyltransferase